MAPIPVLMFGGGGEEGTAVVRWRLGLSRCRDEAQVHEYFVDPPPWMAVVAQPSRFALRFSWVSMPWMAATPSMAAPWAVSAQRRTTALSSCGGGLGGLGWVGGWVGGLGGWVGVGGWVFGWKE
jgi:hypothetical protein